jgi:hypothetical protein
MKIVTVKMKKGSQTTSKINVWDVRDEKEALKKAIEKYPGWWIMEVEVEGIVPRNEVKQ